MFPGNYSHFIKYKREHPRNRVLTLTILVINHSVQCVGVIGIYHKESHAIEISTITNSRSASLMCFQLVQQDARTYIEIGDSECVDVGERISIPSGLRLEEAKIVGCGRYICSEPSPVVNGQVSDADDAAKGEHWQRFHA